MTIQEARIILSTYTLPMTTAELVKYRQALVMVSGYYFRRPE